jgi:hypothetical protein
MRNYTLCSLSVLTLLAASAVVEASVQTEPVEASPLCTGVDASMSREVLPASDAGPRTSSVFCSFGMPLPAIDACVGCAAMRARGPIALCDLAEAAFQRQILPEPATIAVWSLIGLCWSGVSCWRRRRGFATRDGAWDRVRTQRHSRRPPWPDHVRARILEIIEKGAPR